MKNLQKMKWITCVIVGFSAMSLLLLTSGKFIYAQNAQATPAWEASSRISTSGTALSGIDVAVLNEGSNPTYFTGGLQNDYSSMVTALAAEGANATSVTSSQVSGGILLNYDVFIMVDNAPSSSCQTAIRNAWMTGTAIIAFDSSICALCYFGILPSVSSGSNGQSTYWEYNTATNTRVSRSHAITANYSVNALVAGNPGDAQWKSTGMSGVSEYSRITVLAVNDGDTGKWTVALYEPASYAPVVFFWDETNVKNTALKPMIIQAVKYVGNPSGNHAPTLQSGAVTPTSGTTSTWFTFSVMYTDIDNNTPSYVNLKLDSYTYSMTKNWASDTNYVDGCQYVSSSMTLSTGSHSFWFITSDGSLTASTTSQSGPIVGSTSSPYFSDEYVTPSSGDTSTWFYYYVTYYHPGNIAPVSIYVNIDGWTYVMQKSYSWDSTYSDGCEYQYVMSLSATSHTYYFYASDGTNQVTSAVISGPWVSSTSGPSLSSLSVTPSSGDANTYFTFKVLYTHPDNYMPSYIVLYIDDWTYTMSKESSWDTTYSDGCYYVYTTRLSAGSHSYSVYCIAEDTLSYQTPSSVLSVRSSSIINDPAFSFTVVFIVLGSVMTVSTVAIAYKIKVKKVLLPSQPVSSMSTVPTGLLPPSAFVRQVNTFDPFSGGGGGGGAALPVRPQSLPPSAFVGQPMLAARNNPPASTSSITTPPREPSAQAPILPGSPKWMRLAQYDISQYIAPQNPSPPQVIPDDQVAEPDLAAGPEPDETPGTQTPTSDNDDTFEDIVPDTNVPGEEDITPFVTPNPELDEVNNQDNDSESMQKLEGSENGGNTVSNDYIDMDVNEPIILEERSSKKEEALLETAGSEFVSAKSNVPGPVIDTGETRESNLAPIVLRVQRRDFSTSGETDAEDIQPIKILCPSCGSATIVKHFDAQLTYYCKKCQKPMNFEVECPNCSGKSMLTQDEIQGVANRLIKCQICWESVKI
nr:hypothetical protein [Candidatus Sigynarchaeota archaeon]